MGLSLPELTGCRKAKNKSCKRPPSSDAYFSKKQPEEALGHLQERELVNPYRREKEERSGQSLGKEYIFKHAVTHEVTYRTLLRARRQALHQTAAEAIESLFTDHAAELAPTLAFHES